MSDHHASIHGQRRDEGQGVWPKPAQNRMPLPSAWQATADNTVDRQYTDAAANAQAQVGQKRISDVRKRLVEASATIDGVLRGLDEVDRVMAGAPSEELATAEQALIDLNRRNNNLIAECRRWKQQAEQKRLNLSTALGLGTGAKWPDIFQRAEQLLATRATPETPNEVIFVRRGTPGDSVRFLAGEVMKHAQGNLQLAGTAMALNMVAADVDSLPQGRP